MKRSKVILPRITTRGYYDLRNGKKLKTKNFGLYPRKKFTNLLTAKEITIFVHGMRNTSVGAISNTRALIRKAKTFGYNQPIISFSYDSNIRGTGSKNRNIFESAVLIATDVARKNGAQHLYSFLVQLAKINKTCQINLIGHSLGCVVIEALIKQLSITPFRVFPPIKSIHFIGSPIHILSVLLVSSTEFVGKVFNHYNPNDQVIRDGVENFGLSYPSCLYAPFASRLPLKLEFVKSFSKDHSFKSYLKTLNWL